jgi:hypothetical protein
MAALRHVLLDTDATLQLLGCQVLAAVAARAPAALLQQLMAADACEHAFEVLRGTLSSCSMRARILATPPAGGGAVASAEDAAEALQATCVAALQSLATQGVRGAGLRDVPSSTTSTLNPEP